MVAISTAVIFPGRRTCRTEFVHSTIVDSIPMVHGPPSSTRSTDSPKSLITCCALVGLTCPKRLADGATTASPTESNNAIVMLCAGIRKATVSRAPVTQSGTSGVRGTRSVRGPGHRALASISADSFSTPHRLMSSRGDKWMMSGCDVGRPFTWKTRDTAVSFSASAARPYTVSVGIPTIPPC